MLLFATCKDKRGIFSITVQTWSHQLGFMFVTFLCRGATLHPAVQTITAWLSPCNSVYLCVKLTFRLHWWPPFVDQFARKCIVFTLHRNPGYPWQYVQLPGKCDIQTNRAGVLLTLDFANVLHYPTQGPVCPGWEISSLSVGEWATTWQLHKLLIVHNITLKRRIHPVPTQPPSWIEILW